MFADIPLTLAGDHLIGIDQYQPINTVIEIGIDPEIEETHPAGFAEFRILLVQGGHTDPQKLQLLAQTTEVFPIIVATKDCADGALAVPVDQIGAA